MNRVFTIQDYRKYKSLQQAARTLRKQQTSYENNLWQKIRGKQLCNIQFYRQKILLNRFIIDFYAPVIKLAIEIDGSQHSMEEHLANDVLRDKELNSVNIAVKRYSNIMISTEIDNVIIDIRKCIKTRLSTPSFCKKEGVRCALGASGVDF